jgi:4-hydroxy-4-methyl-2-oxoglutarate aldolase
MRQRQESSRDGFVEFVRTVDGPTLSNAIECLNIRPRNVGFAPLLIRQLFPELGRMCGYAVTARVETMTQMGPCLEEGFLELFEAVSSAGKPAVIALQEIGSYQDYAAHCGEVMATVFKRLGSVGLVSDCAVRDIPEVRALGFQYFARGTVVSHANYRIVDVGVPVQILGLTVSPGDLVHGDENGLLVIPDCSLEQLNHAVDGIRQKERRLLEYIRGDEFSTQGLKGRFIE